MNTLTYKQILDFSTKAHEGQKRKYTVEDYIVHPIAVSNLVGEVTNDESIIYAALLHDVLEDTKVSHEELRVFLFKTLYFPNAKKVLDMVVELTDVFTHEAFPSLNRAKRKALECARLGGVSDGAKLVKRMDIAHNTISITKHDPKFSKLYLKEKKELLKVL
jgi:(p)ppGpp synthase/HD superfamily hydrolase